MADKPTWGASLIAFAYALTAGFGTANFARPIEYGPSSWASCEVGGLLPPEFTRRNVNWRLKFTLAKLEFPDGRKYTSKASRRGATRELLKAGNSLEVAKGSGRWWGCGFRISVGLEMGHAFRIPRTVIALIDSGSVDQEYLPPTVPGGKKRRLKWRHTHAKALSGIPPAPGNSPPIGRSDIHLTR